MMQSGGGAGGFNQSVPKLPPISGCMTGQSAFMPYDPTGASKDGGFLPSQPKNMGMNNGLYDYQPQHMLTNQLMQEVGMSRAELLDNFKMKPYDMQYQHSMSGLMGQNMNMYNSKMHQKDSFDNADPQRTESFTITNPLMPNSSMKPRVAPMGLMTSFNSYQR